MESNELLNRQDVKHIEFCLGWMLTDAENVIKNPDKFHQKWHTLSQVNEALKQLVKKGRLFDIPTTMEVIYKRQHTLLFLPLKEASCNTEDLAKLYSHFTLCAISICKPLSYFLSNPDDTVWMKDFHVPYYENTLFKEAAKVFVGLTERQQNQAIQDLVEVHKDMFLSNEQEYLSELKGFHGIMWFPTIIWKRFVQRIRFLKKNRVLFV